MASFDSLPRELRDMIYTYSLVVDVEIIPYPRLLDIHSKQKYQKTKAQYPSPALLAVSKRIRTETIPILYGKNIWRLPQCPYAYAMFRKHPLSFRRVTEGYVQTRLPSNRKRQIQHIINSLSNIEFATGNNSVDARPKGGFHKTLMAQMYALWHESRRTLSDWQGLKEITIDLQQSSSANGCLHFRYWKKGGVFYGSILRSCGADGIEQWLEGVPADQLPEVTFRRFLGDCEKTSSPTGSFSYHQSFYFLRR